MKRLRFRVGSALAFLGLGLSFILSWHLGDPTPFTVVGGASVAGKWMESTAQRWRENGRRSRPQPRPRRTRPGAPDA